MDERQTRPRRRRSLLVALGAPVTAVVSVVLVMLGASPAAATWSLVAVDEETGQVGVALASCVPAEVLGNRDEVLVPVLLAPGVAAGVAQGTPDATRIETARAALLDRQAPDVVVDVALDGDEFESARQYGIVSLLGSGESLEHQFNGSELDPEVASATDEGVAVQGLLLADRSVIDRSLETFRSVTSRDGPLAEALARGLLAGSEAGGDRRCGSQSALFAQLAVARAFDDPAAPELLLTVTVDEGDGQNPVALLVAALEEGDNGWMDRGESSVSGVSRTAVLIVGLVLGVASVAVLRRGLGARPARR